MMDNFRRRMTGETLQRRAEYLRAVLNPRFIVLLREQQSCQLAFDDCFPSIDLPDVSKHFSSCANFPAKCWLVTQKFASSS
jgi:hypothetical protein